jgi:DDE domain
MILSAIAEKLKRRSKDDFKGRHFEATLILQAVSWYLRYPLSYRDIEELFLERGLEVDHSTLNRWVLAYAPQIERRLRSFRKPHCGSIRIDETYIRIRGEWRYLYRAINKHGNPVDFTKDQRALLAFYDLPAEHWQHLRTTNPIESVFATVRHRTVRTKGSLSSKTARLMVFKLVMAASKTWRRLMGENQLPKVIPVSDSRTAPRSSRCHHTAPPDRPRHLKSVIAPGPMSSPFMASSVFRPSVLAAVSLPLSGLRS